MTFSCENHRAPATREFMLRARDLVREPIIQATAPLICVEKGDEFVAATGVLLAVRGKHFILSAAHIFDGHHWKSRPIPLNVTDRVPGKPLIPIGEVTMRRSPTADPVNRLDDDPFDLCVIDITKDTAERIAAGGATRFLSLDDLDPWAEQDLRDSFTVAGFPSVLQDEPGTDSITTSICFFTTFLYGGEGGNVPWTDADRGVGILVDYGNTTTENDDGSPATPPDPRGMSGGGMWRVAQYGCDMARWTTADVKLIGIQSCLYTDQRMLRGTRIEHHLGCIYRGHEDLRPEFDREYGPEAKKRWLY